MQIPLFYLVFLFFILIEINCLYKPSPVLNRIHPLKLFDKLKEAFFPPPPPPFDAPLKLQTKEWQQKLSDEEYYVLRDAGTERPWTSPLNKEKRKGVFKCSGCDQPLFPSSSKYESGTGWPSFFAPIDDDAVATRRDTMLGITRTEVLCSNCGGHLGHVFNGIDLECNTM
jgi:methionine-R-sulfoxide reductase